LPAAPEAFQERKKEASAWARGSNLTGGSEESHVAKKTAEALVSLKQLSRLKKGRQENGLG